MEKIIIYLVPAVLISFVLQLILHEVGHLIGGLITGWKFLYIHVYRIVILREDKRLSLMIVKEKGYRCIMYPKSIDTNALIYTMGGCIVNLLSGISGFIIMIICPLSPVMWLYTWCFVVFGIGMFFMNGIASTKRVCNDKACYKLLKADKQTRKCHNGQLLIAKDLIKGLTYSQIRRDVICLCPKVATDDIQAYQAILEHYYHLDTKDLLKVGQALNKIQSKGNISKEIVDITEMELNYVLLISALIFRVSDDKNFYCDSCFDYDSDYESSSDIAGKNIVEENSSKRKVNKNRIDSDIPSEITLNLKEIKKAIIAHEKEGDVHSLRVKTVHKAYESLISKDIENNEDHCIDIINKAVKEMKETSYIYKGEVMFNIGQLLWVKEMIRSIKDKDRRNNIEKAM